MGFIIALQFLTILPIPKFKQVKPGQFGRSLTYFPLIGLLLGAILFAIHYCFTYIFPAAIVNTIVIIALVVLTGAHHLDGFIDTFDGLVAGKSRKRRLEIMADSHVGAFGIIAVVLLLLLKYASLSNIALMVPALFLMPVLSRWMMVYVIYSYNSAKATGMGVTFKHGATRQSLTIATVITLVISILFLWWSGVVIMAALWLICWGIASYFRSCFGGLTGDNYGALNELAEVISLLLMIIVWRIL
jgi:adenosylcobinamide-GDP ribazoletransferase